MGTLYSDIYIDGMNTEMLAAEGAQIKEAWLNGECIWKLAEKLEYAREIVCFARYNGKYYGFGYYAMNDSPLYNQWKRVYFTGEDIEDLNFNYVNIGNGVNDVFSGDYAFITGRAPYISVFDFGIGVFKNTSSGNDYLMNIAALPGHDIESTLVSDAVSVNDLIGDEIINVSYQGKKDCNVFSGNNQICGTYSDTSSVLIYNTNSKTKKYVKCNDDVKIVLRNGRTYSESAVYCTHACAYMGGKIFFVPYDTGYYTGVRKIVPLFYMDETDLSTLNFMEIDLSQYTGFEYTDTWFEADKTINEITGGGIGADQEKVVFGLQLGFGRVSYAPDEVKTILVQYTKGKITQEEIPVPYDGYISSSSISLLGKYIIIQRTTSGSVIYFMAGESIGSVKNFVYYAPFYLYQITFYADAESLYFDGIYTPGITGSIAGGTSTHGDANSVVIKHRVNLEDGTVEVISQTEINGRLED